MKKALLLVLVVFAAGILGCSSMQQYSTYQTDMSKAKKMLDNADYKQALESFVDAAKAMPKEPDPYAYAATASYKLNNIEAASGYIRDAVQLNKSSDAYIRIPGYKALILLRQGRHKEGMDALNDYIQNYEQQYAARNVRDIKAMWRSNKIDLPTLEEDLDEGITNSKAIWRCSASRARDGSRRSTARRRQGGERKSAPPKPTKRCHSGACWPQ